MDRAKQFCVQIMSGVKETNLSGGKKNRDSNIPFNCGPTLFFFKF